MSLVSLREFHAFEPPATIFCTWCRAPRCSRWTTARAIFESLGEGRDAVDS